MKKMVACIMIVFVYCLNITYAQTVDISSAKNFAVFNRYVSTYDSGNKKIVHLDAAEGSGTAWLNNINFSTGTIEFDVKGKDVLQQSFVGIAFHGTNDSSCDCIYFRPFNFNSADAARKNHSVQYISMPQYDWQYLRQTFPEKYEHALTKSINANSWFHAKIIVHANTIEVFVNNDTNASLIVTPLNKYPSGKIGFWVGNNSDGDFANLTVSK
jgi:hypothetical protein